MRVSGTSIVMLGMRVVTILLTVVVLCHLIAQYARIIMMDVIAVLKQEMGRLFVPSEPVS